MGASISLLHSNYPDRSMGFGKTTTIVFKDRRGAFSFIPSQLISKTNKDNDNTDYRCTDNRLRYADYQMIILTKTLGHYGSI